MRARILLIAFAFALSACSWTQYRGDARHSGVNPYAPGIDSSTVTSLIPAWTSLPHALGWEVTTRDGRAFAPGGAALWALSLETGQDLWHVDRSTAHQFNEVHAATTVATASGSAVAFSEFGIDFDPNNPLFGSADGHVKYLDPATGGVQRLATDASYATPIESRGWLYEPQTRYLRGIHAATERYDLVAIAPGAGTGFVAHFSGPIDDVVSDDTTVFADTNGVTFALPAHGCGLRECTPLWSTSLGQHLALANGTAYGVGFNGVLSAISTDGCGTPTCSPTWTSPALVGSIGGIAVNHDRVFVTTGAKLSVFAANGCGATTCQPLWTSTISGGASAPSVVNDLVFAGSSDGTLNAWRTTGCGAATCPPLWSQDQGGAVGPISPINRALVFPVGGTLGGVLRKLVLPL